MKPNYGISIVFGALGGLLLSTTGLLFVGATGGVSKLAVTGEGAGIEPVFAVPESALWIVIILSAAICGIILTIVTKATARVLDPLAHAASLLILAPIGAIVAAVVAFAVFPLGVTMLGSLDGGVATISIVDTLILTSIIGIVGGGAIVWLAYIMTRPPQHEPDTELLTA